MRLLLFISLLISTYVFADSVSDFSKANELYKKGKYTEAEKVYEAILLSGNESADVYFNLGNSFFKQNKLPQAVLNFERAARLSPGDDDIQFNIKVANSRIVDKIELLPEIFYSRWMKSLKNLYSADDWAMVSIVLLVLAIIAGVIYFLTANEVLQKIGFYLAVVFTIGVCFALGFGYNQFTQLKEAKAAIIFTPTLNVKSSPSENGTNIFVIHEGTKVSLEDRVGTWVKIQLNDGNIGWVEEGSLVVI